jgi:Rrf2 family protein
MLSRKTDYALRAITYLTTQKGRKISTRYIAEKLNIPYKFLTQIFLELVRKGVLASERGSKGGVMLKKPPEEITLLEIVEAVEGPFYLHQCLAEYEESCFFAKGCPIKDTLIDIERKTRNILATTTLDKIKDNYLGGDADENH